MSIPRIKARELAKSLIAKQDPLFIAQLNIRELQRQLAQLQYPEKGDTGEQGIQGEPGKDGYTPLKGMDYFTNEEIGSMMRLVLEAATPRKGIHYNDGKDGERGPMGPKPILGIDYIPRDGKNGVDGQDAQVNIEDIVNRVIEELKNEKLDISHLKGNKAFIAAINKANSFNSKDQRWHGGAPTLIAGSNITITTNADGTKTIASTASAASLTTQVFVTTGGVQILTTTHTPISIILVVLNGQVLAETTDYTVAGSNITLLNPDIPAGLSAAVTYTY